MSFSVFILGIGVVLFLLAFITRRRFGILGLGLLAGSYLAEAWAGQAVPYVERSGITISQLGLPMLAFVTIVITLLPALILLVNSPKQHQKLPKVLGALEFALLAAVLLTPTLAGALTVDGFGTVLNTFVVHNYSVLVTIGIILAIVDLFLSRQSPRAHKSRHAEH